MYFESEGATEKDSGTCALLCPSLDASGKPRRLERQNGAEYIHVPLPGGFERLVWLAAVAVLVFLGSWNGSCELGRFLLISLSFCISCACCSLWWCIPIY
eukprot:Protomagalhaensia_wolfi_Nauph_80__5418@NODE_590_length_2240_cov_203_288505_g137_i1_p6_GENE_NODE_590_length_2240_cov_203_288505_g137_i1NODE_590_length_2240_cov_203_288505_g137_i1_p6_ORF_typecomplete_len100_score0_10DUF3367/PF11847_8/0_017_NODE_590_length_2240_cov_203_288505_g137_i190389